MRASNENLKNKFRFLYTLSLFLSLFLFYFRLYEFYINSQMIIIPISMFSIDNFV